MWAGGWPPSRPRLSLIHILLSGYDAIGLCRYRAGYVNGDLERIEVQHQLLKAAAEQFISLGNIPNIGKVAKILAENTDTNLSAANIAYFIRQALMLSLIHI